VVVLTKMDGDDSGGAALGRGRRRRADCLRGRRRAARRFEAFHAERLVRDCWAWATCSLIERAEAAIDGDSRARLGKKTRLDDFAEDFRDQLKTIKKMGPLEGSWA
jgi:signal recognition particle GTPase